MNFQDVPNDRKMLVVSKFGARDGNPLRKTSKRGTRNTHDVLA